MDLLVHKHIHTCRGKLLKTSTHTIKPLSTATATWKITKVPLILASRLTNSTKALLKSPLTMATPMPVVRHITKLHPTAVTLRSKPLTTWLIKRFLKSVRPDRSPLLHASLLLRLPSLYVRLPLASKKLPKAKPHPKSGRAKSRRSFASIGLRASRAKTWLKVRAVALLTANLNSCLRKV